MSLLELAQRRRNERDPLLKMATAILRLDERIAEEQDAIREQAIIEMDESGAPQILGFWDEKLVERSQQKIASLNDSRAQLESLIYEAETAFEDFGLPAMSDEDLSERIKENQNMAHEIASKINRLARQLWAANPDLTLPEFFANEELQELEGLRSAAIIEGAKKAQRLIELKDRLIPLCSEGSDIATDIFYPHRKAITDPARISEMGSV